MLPCSASAGWHAAALHCAARESWIGWTSLQRRQRLLLIANQSRFLVLPEAGGTPCVASQVLGLSPRWIRSLFERALDRLSELMSSELRTSSVRVLPAHRAAQFLVRRSGARTARPGPLEQARPLTARTLRWERAYALPGRLAPRRSPPLRPAA